MESSGLTIALRTSTGETEIEPMEMLRIAPRPSMSRAAEVDTTNLHRLLEWVDNEAGVWVFT